jgi:hypothetical protein
VMIKLLMLLMLLILRLWVLLSASRSDAITPVFVAVV